MMTLVMVAASQRLTGSPDGSDTAARDLVMVWSLAGKEH